MKRDHGVHWCRYGDTFTRSGANIVCMSVETKDGADIRLLD